MARTALVAAIGLLIALGFWQLVRRSEKLARIAQVEQRLAAPPIAPPGPERWRVIGPEAEYTRLVATGRFRSGADTRVQAVTRFGGGYWLLTPMETRGFILLVNRGFVRADDVRATLPPPGKVTVRGLLRLSEPGGGFLRANDTAGDRWYSRDIPAIAARRGLLRVAPYFLDAEATGLDLPRGGLTVVRLANNHLLYALTWFACAGLLMFLAWQATRRP